MSSLIDRGPGLGRGRRAAQGPLTTVTLILMLTGMPGATRRGHAVPLDDPHVGGIGFSGPTTGDLASVYWNPAALGLMRGLNVTVSGTARLADTTVSRAPIDSSGNPAGAGAMTFGDVHASDRSHPLIWPPGPGAFAGIAGNVGSDRLSLALATYMPFVERSRYQAPPGQELATRYHRISADLRNLAIVTAIAVRFAGEFRVGFAPGILLSTGRISFAESTCAATDTCAGAEDPAGDARVDIGSNQGIFSSHGAVTLAAGVYYRRRAWDFGLSFSSRPLGSLGGSAAIVGDQSQVMRAPRDVTPQNPATVPCDNLRPDGRGCIFADIVYQLPYILSGAVAWHPRPGLELAAIGRVLSFASHDAIDIRLTGAALAGSGVPAHIVLHRGYGTAVDTRLRVASWVAEWLRIGVGLRLESSAVSGDAVSPAAIDGRKIEPTAMFLVRPVRHLWIAGGYAFTFMLPVTVGTSAFDPTAAAACTRTGGDLSPGSPCLLRREGLARGTAAGSYHHHEHAFSLSMTAQF